MRATVEAVFENGVFKPVQRARVREGERVQITVETVTQPGPEGPLELAARVYHSLGPEEIDDIERLALYREHFWRGRPLSSLPVRAR